MKESDLFEPVKELLHKMGCTEVYGEVSNIDVLGIHGACNIIVEMKTTLSHKLIDQIMQRRNYGQYAYIAIPKKRGHIPWYLQKLFKEHRIGVIQVDYDEWEGKYFAYIDKPSRYLSVRKKYIQSVRDSVKPYHKDVVGGGKSGEVMTDYKFTIETVKAMLRQRSRLAEGEQWATIDDILDKCETHYARPKPSLSSALRKFESDWCETKVINGKLHFRYKGEN